MFHIGIDLGARESQICVRREDGEVEWEGSVSTRSCFETLKKYPASRVVMETCSEAFKLADRLGDDGHEVRVVPATLVRQLGVGARGIKTDRRDAQALSIVSCRIDLPSVHIRTPQARLLKSRLGMRQSLVEARTQLINTVRGYLRTELISVRRGSVETFCRRVRAALLEDSCGLSDFVEHQLKAIEALNVEIAAMTEALTHLADSEAVCQRLMTVPGVGTLTALSFFSAVDDVDRFLNAHEVQSYLGLTPGERSSSTRQRRTGITKAGPAPLRRMLCQAAWSLWIRDERVRGRLGRRGALDPLIVWAEQIAERRGRNVAVIALARKLAGILYALWRDGTAYDAQRASRLASGEWRRVA